MKHPTYPPFYSPFPSPHPASLIAWIVFMNRLHEWVTLVFKWNGKHVQCTWATIELRNLNLQHAPSDLSHCNNMFPLCKAFQIHKIIAKYGICLKTSILYKRIDLYDMVTFHYNPLNIKFSNIWWEDIVMLCLGPAIAVLWHRKDIVLEMPWQCHSIAKAIHSMPMRHILAMLTRTRLYVTIHHAYASCSGVQMTRVPWHSQVFHNHGPWLEEPRYSFRDPWSWPTLVLGGWEQVTVPTLG